MRFHFAWIGRVVLLGHMFGAVETLAALAASVGAVRKEKQNPKFEESAALGAMDVMAAALGTTSLSTVDKQAQRAFHWPRIIAPGESPAQSRGGLGNHLMNRANQSEASTCIAWCRSLPRPRFSTCDLGKNFKTGGRRTASRSRAIFNRKSCGA